MRVFETALLLPPPLSPGYLCIFCPGPASRCISTLHAECRTRSFASCTSKRTTDAYFSASILRIYLKQGMYTYKKNQQMPPNISFQNNGLQGYVTSMMQAVCGGEITKLDRAAPGGIPALAGCSPWQIWGGLDYGLDYGLP